MADVRVHLSGGPEEGRQVDVAADASGRPSPRVTLPLRHAPGSRPMPGQRAPTLVYERGRRHRDGTWEYWYVGARLD